MNNNYISSFKVFLRFTILVFFTSSLFTQEWFCLTNMKDSIMIKIGIFKYCDDEDCFGYQTKISIIIWQILSIITFLCLISYFLIRIFKKSKTIFFETSLNIFLILLILFFIATQIVFIQLKYLNIKIFIQKKNVIDHEKYRPRKVDINMIKEYIILNRKRKNIDNNLIDDSCRDAENLVVGQCQGSKDSYFGRKGYTGYPGPKGHPGEPGIPGDAGILIGESQVNEIELKFGQETRDIYIPGVGNLDRSLLFSAYQNAPRGSQGPPGDPGEPGKPGAKGMPGIPGFKGHAGRTGRTGRRGDSGTLGESGNRGAKGLPGVVGRMGHYGKDGYPGERGFAGIPGNINYPCLGYIPYDEIDPTLKPFPDVGLPCKCSCETSTRPPCRLPCPGQCPKQNIPFILKKPDPYTDITPPPPDDETTIAPSKVICPPIYLDSCVSVDSDTCSPPPDDPCYSQLDENCNPPKSGPCSSNIPETCPIRQSRSIKDLDTSDSKLDKDYHDSPETHIEQSQQEINEKLNDGINKNGFEPDKISEILIDKKLSVDDNIVINYSLTWPGYNYGFLCSILIVELFFKVYESLN